MPDLFKQDQTVVTRPYRCRCGSSEFYLEPEHPPHGHHLRCVNCGFGGFWMKKTELKGAE